MKRELSRLAIGLTLIFALGGLATLYWSVWQSADLAARDDNPRRVRAEINIQRGRIYDRNGVTLAYSESSPNTLIGPQRLYPHPEAVAAVGYYSYRFGAEGLEEGMDSWLRGDGLASSAETWWDNTLNRPTQGGDVMSTLDLELQRTLMRTMGEATVTGAGVIAAVPSGEVLALVSLPSYDPNETDSQGRLVAAQQAGSPSSLLNRAVYGRYQPGGALQTLLLSTLLAGGATLDDLASSDAVQLADLWLDCPLAPTSQTLGEVYRAGCPAPFIGAATAGLLTPNSVQSTLQGAGFLHRPLLDGYGLTNSRERSFDLSDDFASEVAGQGRMTVTPLHMLQVITAVVHNGSGIPFHLVAATRRPSNSSWQAYAPESIAASPAIMQPAIASQIETLLASQELAPDVYGHIGIGLAGQRQVMWFLGWTPLDDETKAVAVFVIEGTQLQPDSILEVAAAVLSTLHQDGLSPAP